MTNRVLLFAGLILSLAGLWGCGNNETPGPQGPLKLNGKWAGTFLGPKMSGTKIGFVFQQSKTKLTGSFSAERNIAGTLLGKVATDSISFSLTETMPSGCPGSYDAAGQMVNDTLTLFVSGTDCYGTISDEQLVLTKQ